MSNAPQRLSRAAALLRLVAVCLGLAFLVAIPALAVGGLALNDLSVEQIIEDLRATGWAWAAGLLLIISDIIAPLPASAIMAALGVIYGPLLGGILSSIGGIAAGSIAYGICRLLGEGTVTGLVGRDGLAQAQQLFQRWGFALVVVSRWLPILPETVAFAAGLSRMAYPKFLAGLVCGAVPVGFLFATAGHLGRETPLLIMAVCALLPVVFWIVAGVWRSSARR